MNAFFLGYHYSSGEDGVEAFNNMAINEIIKELVDFGVSLLRGSL